MRYMRKLSLVSHIILVMTSFNVQSYPEEYASGFDVTRGNHFNNEFAACTVLTIEYRIVKEKLSIHYSGR